MNAALLSRLGLWVLSTTFGSVGIFCLHFSFTSPRVALPAILCLGTAEAITLAMENLQ